MADIPDWAKERACELANAVKDWAQPVKWGQAQHYALGQAFARYIAEHEEPPVDPLVQALAVFGRMPGSASHCGNETRAAVLRAALLECGLEIRERSK